jgi:putative transposase
MTKCSAAQLMHGLEGHAIIRCRCATAEILITASKGVYHGVPTVLVDGGTENFNGPVDELIDSGLLHRVLAGTEITYSNSMIES